MMKIGAVQRLVVALYALVWGALPGASALPVKKILNNGLTVLVSPEPGSGRVAAVLMVRAGDVDDPSEVPGANRLLARLLVNSAAHRGPDRFTEFAVDGSVWSAAETDVTTFSAVTTPDQLDTALRLLNVVLEPPPWNTGDMARAVRREADSDADEQPTDYEHDLAVLESRLGNAVSAMMSSSRGPSPDELRRLHARLYTANRMTLAVVGDVTSAEVFAGAGRAFRKIEPDYNKEGKRDRFAARQPKMEPTGTYAFSGYKAPPVTDPDAPAVEVLAAAAGTGKTGFLFRYLRETDGAGYESGAVYPKRLGPSVAALFARSPNDARVMRDRLSALWKQTIDGSPEDLRRARLRAVHNHQAQRQTMRDRAYWLAFRETAGVGAEDEWTTRLAAVTDEQLKACANRWFSGAPAVVP